MWPCAQLSRHAAHSCQDTLSRRIACCAGCSPAASTALCIQLSFPCVHTHIQVSAATGILGGVSLIGHGRIDITDVLRTRERRTLSIDLYSDAQHKHAAGVLNLAAHFVGAWEVDNAEHVQATAGAVSHSASSSDRPPRRPTLLLPRSPPQRPPPGAPPERTARPRAAASS